MSSRPRKRGGPESGEPTKKKAGKDFVDSQIDGNTLAPDKLSQTTFFINRRHNTFKIHKTETFPI